MTARVGSAIQPTLAAVGSGNVVEEVLDEPYPKGMKDSGTELGQGLPSSLRSSEFVRVWFGYVEHSGT